MGVATTAIALVLALVPSIEVTQPWVYEAKLVGGTLLFFAVGLGLYRKGKRRVAG